MIDDNDNDSDDVGLSPAHRALLDGLEGPPLSRAAEDRLRQRVLASVGVGIAVGALASTSAAATTTTTAATTATTGAAVATKATLGAVVAKSVAGVIGAAVIVGGVTIATTAPTPKTTPTTTMTAATPTATTTTTTNDEGTAGDTEPVAATTGTTMPAETAPVSMSPPPPVTVSKRKAPSLEAIAAPPSEPAVDEVTLLDRARRALAANDPARALDLVETAAAQTPSSSFAEERTALQVLALVGVGRRDEAGVLAQRFLSQWPDSLLAPRVRAALR